MTMIRALAIVWIAFGSAAALRAGDAVQSETYSVTIRPSAAADDLSTFGEDLARFYGGRLLPGTDANAGSIAMDLSESQAKLLRADPRVSSVAPSRRPIARPVTHGVEIMPWSTGVNYSYDGSGNVSKIATDSYVYDAVSRLVQGDANGIQRKYEYDAFGNRTNCLQGTTNCQNGATADKSTNRLSSMSYDTAGNVTAYAGHLYSHDAVNMMTRDVFGATAREFVYTADDQRIAVYQVGGAWRWTVRGLDGKPLREFTSANVPGGTVGTGSWAWAKDYVWRDGLLLASRQPETGGTTNYHYHLDHLGTPRRITNDADQIIGIHDYYAFGPEVPGGTFEPSVTSLKYTGHERDITVSEGADTLDYMHARYYAPVAGRFLSVDPVLQVKQAIDAPQMWNRYAYAVGNPLFYSDPTGTTVYIVIYTTGNATGDDEFRRAAETRKKLIESMRTFDAKRDTVILAGVHNKGDFAKTIAKANSLQSQYGKVGELDMFSHAGPVDGPTFHYMVAPLEQFSVSDLQTMKVNWDWWGYARFYGCNTAQIFTQRFADAQGVTAYGFASFSLPSGDYIKWQPVLPGGPVYFVQPNSSYTNQGVSGALKRWFGIDTSVTPLVPADPKPKP